MKKKPSRTTLRNRADKLWSKLILSKGACEVCGRKLGLNAHHIVGRRNLTLRYDPRNGCSLCCGCHRLYKESAHEDPIWFMAWMMQNRPEDYNYLWEQKERLSTSIDYDAIIRQLEGLLSG